MKLHLLYTSVCDGGSTRPLPRRQSRQLPCDASASYSISFSRHVTRQSGFGTQVTLAQDNWQPPSCTGWPAESRSKLIVTVTGSFHFDGGMDALLTKVGAISTLKEIFYWSAIDKKWGHLANDASALSDANAMDRRRDFAASDFVKGTDLYYWEDCESTGPTVYRLKVFESTPQRLVISSDNVTTVHKFIFTLFKPGALQSVLFIQQLSPETFGVYIPDTDRRRRECPVKWARGVIHQSCQCPLSTVGGNKNRSRPSGYALRGGCEPNEVPLREIGADGVSKQAPTIRNTPGDGLIRAIGGLAALGACSAEYKQSPWLWNNLQVLPSRLAGMN